MLAKLLIVPIVLAIGFLGWQVVSNKKISPSNTLYSSPTPATTTNTFTASSVMNGFTVQIPQGFTAEEKFATVTIANQTGKILITQNGTNFENLGDYLNSLEQLNHFNLAERSTFEINTLHAASGFVDKQKTYFIYKNYGIYTISTDEYSLLEELDKIAKSFTLPK